LKRGNGIDGIVERRLRITLFIVKLLEAKQPWELMELKLPRSRKATRKQTDSGGRGRKPIRTVAFTTDHLWSVLAWHSFVLSSFHGHSDLRVSVGHQNTLNYG